MTALDVIFTGLLSGAITYVALAFNERRPR